MISKPKVERKRRRNEGRARKPWRVVKEPQGDDERKPRKRMTTMRNPKKKSPVSHMPDGSKRKMTIMSGEV